MSANTVVPFSPEPAEFVFRPTFDILRVVDPDSDLPKAAIDQFQGHEVRRRFIHDLTVQVEDDALLEVADQFIQFVDEYATPEELEGWQEAVADVLAERDGQQWLEHIDGRAS